VVGHDRDPDPDEQPGDGRRGAAARGLRSVLRAAEIDTRLLGMLVALAVIWVGLPHHVGRDVPHPRNLWILSVQTASVAIMATGMVLVIVSRNIDLSVGSLLAVLGMAMALLQAEILPQFLGFDHPLTWIIALVAGLAARCARSAASRARSSPTSACPPSSSPSAACWSGAASPGPWRAAAPSLPMDSTFQLLGGGSRGSIGGGWSWVVAVVACVGIVALLINDRRQRQKYGFRLRPMWAVITLGVVACGAVLGGVYVLNRYYLPEGLARQYAEDRGIAWPEGGLNISAGHRDPGADRARCGAGHDLRRHPAPVRPLRVRDRWQPGGRRAGRHQQPRTIVKTFALMGSLVGLAAAVQIARLNAAVSGLGQLTELYVIAAAVIGGTSFAGGIGTIPGAVLGALLMQSLQSGMVLMNVDAPLQNIVVGIVLVIAVTLDSIYRRRAN
jgi:D-xylose transport system permease protein